MNKNFVIKELKLDEDNPMNGCQAISFVSTPAVTDSILEYFAKNNISVSFAQGKLPFFRYTASPDAETIPTSHAFCRQHAGKVYHVSEIKKFVRNHEWKNDSNFFHSFDGEGDAACEDQIFECRHWLQRVSSLSEVPRNKWSMLSEELENFEQNEELFFEFSAINPEKREVQGLALKSGDMIYRHNADGHGNKGYVWMSRDTVRKLAEKFGYNRAITLQHEKDITGAAILLNSWTEEDDENNCTKWYLKYKVVSDNLWQLIKDHKVKGYSIESIFTIS